jgi:hypothetical protein
MLDNLEGEELLGAARTLKEEWREKMKKGDYETEGSGKGVGKGFLIESSGGIEEDNIKGRLSNGTHCLFFAMLRVLESYRLIWPVCLL